MIFDLETSWQIWRMLEAVEWQHLPEPGGLLDQDERLMHDLTVISWRSGLIEELAKQSKENNF